MAYDMAINTEGRKPNNNKEKIDTFQVIRDVMLVPTANDYED